MEKTIKSSNLSHASRDGPRRLRIPCGFCRHHRIHGDDCVFREDAVAKLPMIPCAQDVGSLSRLLTRRGMELRSPKDPTLQVARWTSKMIDGVFSELSLPGESQRHSLTCRKTVSIGISGTRTNYGP
ncbi:hypothetical protein BDP55DRAFT_90645 [Colletotrichum godetiae]|uniref:Uncharacterized protein n=1 Tax=Colletotrichum godetiae TaxID=1209918 RepID=A0AAJ0AR68_9PEZI|nr:uncharacterized protein BDP55DRAFT_90645 [Colletotrichum godetiae]KAK1687305.1 hypothetical protein BDP55DRAFT_90645 [Colletotrichum godetiae]